MKREYPTNLYQNKIKVLIREAGCPASNTRCLNLINNRCSLENPEVYYRVKDMPSEGYCCGSCKF